MVATVRALKMHGGVGRIVAGKPLDPALAEENVDAVRKGSDNLAAQIENVRVFNVPVVVAVNHYPGDTDAEVASIREVALAAGARDVVVSRHFAEGGAGAEDLAHAVWAAAEEGAPDSGSCTRTTCRCAKRSRPWRCASTAPAASTNSPPRRRR